MLCTHKTASSASLVLEICHQFNNSFLNQFSSIFGGNCIREKPSLAANSIAENLFAQIDDDGNRQVLMDDIIGHRSNEHAVKQQDAFIITKMGTKRRKETTKGWELLIRWKDGGTDWIALKDVKESYPVQVAEYAVLAHISEEPAFTWWASSVLKKHNRIIAKIKSKYWLRTHKFRIEIPKSVTQARQIDAKCGNMLWWDAICKEMKNVRPAFEVFEGAQISCLVGTKR